MKIRILVRSPGLGWNQTCAGFFAEDDMDSALEQMEIFAKNAKGLGYEVEHCIQEVED